MKIKRKSQSVLITGVTGAGKTVAAKHLIQFLSANETSTSLNNTISKAGSILDFFGNASTIANTNSSRYSKFIEVSRH